MRTILEIRENLEILLAEEIGLYSYPNGQTTNAIASLPDNVYGWEFPPPGTTVSDLEVVLIPDAEIKNKSLLTGSYINSNIAILLKQWNPNKTTVVSTKKIVENFPESLIVKPRILPNISLGNIETQTILLLFAYVNS